MEKSKVTLQSVAYMAIPIDLNPELASWGGGRVMTRRGSATFFLRIFSVYIKEPGFQIGWVNSHKAHYGMAATLMSALPQKADIARRRLGDR
jgi:hypothetical protein